VSSGTGEVAVVVAYPGARRPDRRRTVDSNGSGYRSWSGVRETDPPLAIAHGGFDFAETLDVFAPMLADAGWRVVSWDQRGHGDSAWAHLYSWEADLRDAAAVIATLPPGPMPFVGHSKGGSMMMHLANVWPASGVGAGQPRRSALGGHDDRRRGPRAHPPSARRDGRVAGAPSDPRRQAATPRHDRGAGRAAWPHEPALSIDWLRYLVTVGATHGDDGWRWKLDPTMRMGGFGPWRPEWSMLRLPGLGVPVLGVLGMELEVMGWGTRPPHVLPYLPPGGRFETLEGVGHFVHIEQPRLVADMVLEFLS
jgi:pimeloyl-ACP methyl ester carboxylesterase